MVKETSPALTGRSFPSVSRQVVQEISLELMVKETSFELAVVKVASGLATVPALLWTTSRKW